MPIPPGPSGSAELSSFPRRRPWRWLLALVLAGCGAVAPVTPRPPPVGAPSLPPVPSPAAELDESDDDSPGLVRTPAQLVPTVLTASWIDAVLLAPAGARIGRVTGGLRIRAPKFDMEVRPHSRDLFALRVALLREGKVHVEPGSDDLLVYRTRDAAGEAWHVLAMIMTGGQVFRCESSQGRRFQREDALRMAQACGTLTARSVATDDTVR